MYEYKDSMSDKIFIIFCALFGLFFVFMLIFEGPKEMFSIYINDTIIKIAKNIFGLLINDIYEGFTKKNESPILAIIGLVVFVVVCLIAIIFAIGCTLLVLGSFIVFPLVVALSLLPDFFSKKKEPFNFKIFLHKKMLSIRGLTISAIDGIFGAIFAFGFLWLIILFIKLF